MAAVPGFFATMDLERRYLQRRDAGVPSAVTYTGPDTNASLTMGTLSLVVPLLTRPVMRRLAPQQSRVGKVLLGAGLAAAAATTVADAWTRRHRRSTPPIDSTPGRETSEHISRIGGTAAVVTLGIAGCAAWQAATATSRFWRRGKARDLGAGPRPAALALLGWDFIYYWNHRWMHTARWMWAHHVVHHSSQRFNLSTALCQPIAESLGVFAPYGVMCLGGIRPSHIETARGLNLLYQYWFHTDTVRRLGPAEQVFNTASHHRVHHGSNQQYIDRNHGSILIVWDRLFGTFAREDDAEPVVYGLTKNVGSYSPWRIATHEYADLLGDVARSTTWRDRASFVLRGPGWAYRRRAELDAARVDRLADDAPAAGLVALTGAAAG
jgi:sterol desaturase/sphingolipid hydroxylase (fatty acid hydroxylase superfamily)